MPGCCNRILQSMGNRWKKNTHTPTHAIYISTGFNGIFGGRHHWFSSRQQQAFYTFPLSKEGGLFSLRTHTHTKTPLPSLPSPLPVAIQPQLSTLPNPLQPYTVTKQLSLKLITRPSLTSIHTNAKGTVQNTVRGQDRQGQRPLHWDLWNIKKKLNLHSFS